MGRLCGALCGALVSIALAGCGGALSPEDDRAMLEVFELTKSGEFDAIETRLNPILRTPESRVVLERLNNGIANAGEPCERTFVSATTTRVLATSGTGRRVTARHQYACPNATFVVDTRLWIAADAAPVIEHFHFTPVNPEAAAAAQKFSFAGKNWRHYVFFAIAVASPLLMLLALLGALFTKGFKRKWIWMIVALAGIGKFSMIWPTGEIHTALASINLIGFGVTRAGHALAPWVVSFTPPLGAIIVLSLLLPRWTGAVDPNEQPEFQR